MAYIVMAYLRLSKTTLASVDAATASMDDGITSRDMSTAPCADNERVVIGVNEVFMAFNNPPMGGPIYGI